MAFGTDHPAESDRVAQQRPFPDAFLWGCATAAHQVEGGNHNNDWWEFERRGGIRTGDSADPACDHYQRYREDFRLLREICCNAHRLSIEWSRIEPSPGVFDVSEIDHYRSVLCSLRDQGMTPMVTLHHFTSPLWFSRRGGWAASGSAQAWQPFVRRVAEELGELVDLWCTFNEPNIYAYQGWLEGEFPPARRGDIIGMYRVLANFRRAHEAAYRELKRICPDTPVGIAHHKWLMKPASERRRDRTAAGLAQALMDRWPVGGGRLQRVVEAPGDYLGLNHYSGSLVALGLRQPAHGLVRLSNPPDALVSDFGWAIRPEWLRVALEELRHLGKPVYVTESGVATADDSLRREYLVATLLQVWEAIQAGLDVRGYFHWSSTDNFEWARGYSMRFGLIGVDRRTQQRTVKPSGRLFAEIARANALPC